MRYAFVKSLRTLARTRCLVSVGFSFLTKVFQVNKHCLLVQAGSIVANKRRKYAGMDKMRHALILCSSFCFRFAFAKFQARMKSEKM